MTTIDAGPLPGPMPEAVVHPGPMPEAEPTPVPVAVPTGSQPADVDAESESRPVGERSSRVARRARRTRMRRVAPAPVEVEAVPAPAAEPEPEAEPSRAARRARRRGMRRAPVSPASAGEPAPAPAPTPASASASAPATAPATAPAPVSLSKDDQDDQDDQDAAGAGRDDQDAAGAGRDWWRRRPARPAPAAPAPAPAAPASVVAPAPAPTPVPRVTDRRLRWALRSGSAAATGHLLIWGVTGDPMAGAALMERLTASVPQLASAGLTAACLYGGWHGVKRIRLHKLPGIFGLAARPAGSLIAALWAQGTAPVVADLMAMTAPWSTLLAPLLAAGPVAAGCWYVLDRRAARARLIPPARWAAHIPLATTCLSALLYAPGAAL